MLPIKEVKHFFIWPNISGDMLPPYLKLIRGYSFKDDVTVILLISNSFLLHKFSILKRLCMLYLCRKLLVFVRIGVANTTGAISRRICGLTKSVI